MYYEKDIADYIYVFLAIIHYMAYGHNRIHAI